ncbi:uncharacterized protein LOC143276110 [Babylonia areolata]|uniref:uncharacterized protein LOC143276110 n=1 Tax=Babylonia areolata TaxID=304850 RepID=UPI003FD4AF5F
MAFNVSYNDLLRKNIRHIYSSLPSNIRFRCDPEPSVTLNPHDGCVTSYKGFLRQPPGMPEALYRRLWAYSPEYKSAMPRAPAFRCVSASEARVIVDRVSQMTKTHRKRRQSYRPEENEEGDTGEDRSATPLSARGGRRCRSAAEMNALNDRVMRPTTASQIRSDLREGHGLDPVMVVRERSSEES